MHAPSRPAWKALTATLLATLAACASSGAPASRGEPASAVRDNPGGAVSTVSAAEFERSRSSSIEEVLAGRVPGLQVVRASNGDVKLRIRNAVSFLGNDEPLLVIDGMLVHSGRASGALRGLNPRDVARVEVLRDAGSTAFYGVRGANGVVLITTKLRN